MTVILGIETSCDDTCAAVVKDGVNILSNVISSQEKAHAPFGGIVPEIAARKHIETVAYIIEMALERAGIGYQDIEAVAVTADQGLLRSLVVGVAAGKALAASLNVPLISIHHIEGHIYSNLIEHGDALEFPHICLTVSGGHTLLLRVSGIREYELLGRTLDDAAGEAFDKISKFMGLGFPGGPVIDKLAQTGDPARFDFPRPMLDRENYDFSFSGLKTAVINTITELRQSESELPVVDIAASFQQAVVDTLVQKTRRAAEHYGISTISVCGGVAANKGLRSAFEDLSAKRGFKVYYPRMSLCTDNGAMIAGLAYYKLQAGLVADFDLDARATAPLADQENLTFR